MKQTRFLPILATTTVLAVTLLGGMVDVFMNLSFENALQLAGEQDKLIMAKFHADWCHWCRKMDKDTFSDREVQDSLKEFIPVRVDVDEKWGLDLALKLSLVNLPTIVFFDASGAVVGQYVGYLSPEEMKRVLKSHADPDKKSR